MFNVLICLPKVDLIKITTNKLKTNHFINYLPVSNVLNYVKKELDLRHC